jgi:MFS transporter, AAHS family, 4-hydroxybenzoate transporter
MAAIGATTFGEAVSRAPMRAFQWATVLVCMLVLVCDGMDMQLLGIIAPRVIADFGVTKGTFGIAMSAALVGFGLGSWGGGWLGDKVGRRYALALAALIFSLGTVAASQAGGVTEMAMWRVLGGLGFGAAYANALAMASEWLPERFRSVAVATLSVGTPIGGTVVGYLAPRLVDDLGWRGTFVTFGCATMLLVLIVIAVLRDSPSFLLSKGKPEQAARAARRVLTEDVPLTAEVHDMDSAGGVSIGVLHRSNLRLNVGIGVAFAACALVAYGILNWTTTMLTTGGREFDLKQAGAVVAVAGITSMAGSITAGILTRQLGSKLTMILITVTLVLLMTGSGFVVEHLPAMPDANDRMLVTVLIGAAAAVFSAGIACMYVIMALGYPQSCRSAGIGFGIFMSRVGAVAASAFGGALLDLGKGSVVPFFGVLVVGAALVSAAAFVVDRHVPPAARKAA